MPEPQSTPFANGWIPRPFQQDAIDAFHAGHRRQLLIWHRRAGKDNYALNLANQLATEEVGTYWHLFPYAVQARKAIFNGIGNDGVRFIDQAFPPETRKRTLTQDMMIELENGSIWQMAGSDAYDRLVGANVRGVIFSEWALCDPAAWNYIKPIIRENGGFVVMITTYRGRNHAYRMAKRLASNPEWLVDVRTINDTTDHDGDPLLTDLDIELERAEGTSEALLQQEYYCNPMAAPEGSVYGKALEKLQTLGRLEPVSYDASKPVAAVWTTQFDDQYSVIFTQQHGDQSRVIGSKRYPFADLSDAIDDAKTAFPWKHCARHVLAADASPATMQLFDNADLTVDLAPETPDVIKLTRARLGSTVIDSAHRPWVEGDDENNAALVDSLSGYRFPKTKAGGFQAMPSNTWEKHFARCFETFSAWREMQHAGRNWNRRPTYAAHDRAVI